MRARSVVWSLLLVLGLTGCISSEGPLHTNATEADIVVRGVTLERGSVAGGDGYAFDTVVLAVDEVTFVHEAAAARTPPVGDVLEALDLRELPIGEDLVTFLRYRPDGTIGWDVSFALDAGTGEPIGEFDTSMTRDGVDEVVGDAPSGDRAAVFVDWARGPAAERLENQDMADVASTYFGRAVAGDATADRVAPFDLEAWRAQQADERLLPVSADDPAAEPLVEELALVGTALVVRPNAAYTTDITHVALEVVDVGLLGWLELRDVPTGLVGAMPLDGTVRVLGRTVDGTVEQLPLLSDRAAGDTIELASLTDHRVGPRSIVIDLAPSDEDDRAVSLHTTTIDELGLLLERAGR